VLRRLLLRLYLLGVRNRRSTVDVVPYERDVDLSEKPGAVSFILAG
jgi:hypothetical protein